MSAHKNIGIWRRLAGQGINEWFSAYNPAGDVLRPSDMQIAYQGNFGYWVELRPPKMHGTRCLSKKVQWIPYRACLTNFLTGLEKDF
jgi:hypothetical protein